MYRNQHFTNRNQHFTNRKYSYGIACCRYNTATRKPEILLIKKRYTYCYAEFVFGRYSKNKNSHLLYLFNHMTVDEKLDILSLNFGLMWYRIWLTNPDSVYESFDKCDVIKSNYLKRKKKFQNTFLIDSGRRLRALINKSKSVDPIWEIPKGRKADTESRLESAVREFTEETGVEKDDYMLLPDITPYEDSHISMRVKYTNSWYIALIKPNKKSLRSLKIRTDSKKTTISFERNDQIVEICDIGWFSLDRISIVDKSGRLTRIAGSIFKILKKRYNFSSYYRLKLPPNRSRRYRTKSICPA